MNWNPAMSGSKPKYNLSETINTNVDITIDTQRMAFFPDSLCCGIKRTASTPNRGKKVT